MAERAPLCDEAIRLARLLLRLFPAEPEVMGLTALLLLQHSRAAARFDAEGQIVLLDDQDRSKWNAGFIAEGSALIDKAMRHRQPGPYQVQAAIAALHARAEKPEDTDWAQIDLLYQTLERLQPSPVVTLNRAVAVSKMKGPAAALEMIAPLETRLGGYFHFHGARVPSCSSSVATARRGPPSIRRLPWPTRRPKPRISVSTSTSCTRKPPAKPCREENIHAS